jgi:hypothetical protein
MTAYADRPTKPCRHRQPVSSKLFSRTGDPNKGLSSALKSETEGTQVSLRDEVRGETHAEQSLTRRTGKQKRIALEEV